MPENQKRTKKTRTVGVNFPHDNAGDFVHEALLYTMEQEDRSASRVAYRIVKDYFDGGTDDFKDIVNERMDAKLAAAEVHNESQGQKDDGFSTE